MDLRVRRKGYKVVFLLGSVFLSRMAIVSSVEVWQVTRYREQISIDYTVTFFREHSCPRMPRVTCFVR